MALELYRTARTSSRCMLINDDMCVLQYTYTQIPLYYFCRTGLVIVGQDKLERCVNNVHVCIVNAYVRIHVQWFSFFRTGLVIVGQDKL